MTPVSKWGMFVLRAKVVLGSAITWITTAQAIVIIVADEISKLLAPEQAETVTRISVRVLAVLTSVVLIIRRSFDVRKSERGLL